MGECVDSLNPIYPIRYEMKMDEWKIIYALAGIIVTIVGFVVRRELSREKDKEKEVGQRIQDKEKEIQRVTEELISLRTRMDKIYEEAIQKRIQNGTIDRR